MMSDETLQLPPTGVTNEQLYLLMQQLHAKSNQQGKAIEDTAGELAKLREDMDAGNEARKADNDSLKAEIDQVLQPWKAAKMLGTILKWFAATIILVSAAGAAVLGMVEGIRAWVRG